MEKVEQGTKMWKKVKWKCAYKTIIKLILYSNFKI